jgi:hypothetical protein
MFDVLANMSSLNQQRTQSRWENMRGPQIVAAPAPHEGVRRALLGSFGSIPAMPEEFARLLEQLR